MNSVNLVGSLGKDPELKQGKNGNSVCKFSLATNDGYGDHKRQIGIILFVLVKPQTLLPNI